MAYNVEIYREPFWAKSGNFVRDRDPLGVQKIHGQESLQKSEELFNSLLKKEFKKELI